MSELVVPDLVVEGLLVTARDGRVLLDLPRLAVPAGATLAVTGPSGAGKTTLLHVLSGLLAPDRGRVLWGGTDIAALPDAGRARFRRERLGLVFQDALLFDELSAEANAAVAAAFAPRPARAGIEASARMWLGRLGLGAQQGQTVQTLSGGERQRVGVARALCNDPPVVLADEPTASLDRATADRLIADLVAACAAAGRTLIAVTHDGHLAARLAHRLQLENGRPVGSLAHG